MPASSPYRLPGLRPRPPDGLRERETGGLVRIDIGYDTKRINRITVPAAMAFATMANLGSLVSWWRGRLSAAFACAMWLLSMVFWYFGWRATRGHRVTQVEIDLLPDGVRVLGVKHRFVDYSHFKVVPTGNPATVGRCRLLAAADTGDEDLVLDNLLVEHAQYLQERFDAAATAARRAGDTSGQPLTQ